MSWSADRSVEAARRMHDPGAARRAALDEARRRGEIVRMLVDDPEPPPWVGTRHAPTSDADVRAALIRAGVLVPRATRDDGLVHEPALDARIDSLPCLTLDAVGRRRGARDAGGTGDARILGQRDERRGG